MQSIREQAALCIAELCDASGISSGSTVVVGCSTSEVAGGIIGHDSNIDIANEIFEGIYSELNRRGIILAVQCCEHLNRAIIIERDAINNGEIVNVVPQIKAGGAFATVAYRRFNDPVAIEEIKADAGIDIGQTLIGMHLKRVAVPIRLKNNKIGCASVTAARTRPKFIGGCRAVYDEKCM